MMNVNKVESILGDAEHLYFGCIAAGIPKPLVQARTQ